MNQEKILAFLDCDIKKNVDTFTMKLFTWFNISFGLFIIFFGVILKFIDLSLHNILFIVFSLVSNILFFLFIRCVKIVIFEWIHHFVVAFCTTLTLCYGWLTFSKGELIKKGYPIFGWWHVAILFAAVVLGSYFVIKYICIIKMLRNNTIEQAKAIVGKRIPMSIPIFFAVSPMFFVRILRGPFQNAGLGIGFAMWGLMCIWLFFTIVVFPKIFIIFKYKVYKWFQ